MKGPIHYVLSLRHRLRARARGFVRDCMSDISEQVHRNRSLLSKVDDELFHVAVTVQKLTDLDPLLDDFETYAGRLIGPRESVTGPDGVEFLFRGSTPRLRYDEATRIWYVEARFTKYPGDSPRSAFEAYLLATVPEDA